MMYATYTRWSRKKTKCVCKERVIEYTRTQMIKQRQQNGNNN